MHKEPEEINLNLYNEPCPELFIAESGKVISRALEAGIVPVSVLYEERMKDNPEISEVLYEVSDKADVCSLPGAAKDVTGYNVPSGIICLMRRPEVSSPSDILAQVGNHSRIAVLVGVEDPTFMGTVFRSAAAFSVDAVLISRKSIDPLERRASRVSMGTVFKLPWTYIADNNINEVLHELGYKTAAINWGSDSYADMEGARKVSLDSEELRDVERLAIVIIGEGSMAVRADYIVDIPMALDSGCLTPASQSAVVFWELAGRG